MAILTAASIVCLALFGYLAGGLLLAKVRLDAADGAYAAAAGDQKSIGPGINSLKSSDHSGLATGTASQRAQERAAAARDLAFAQSAQTQIDFDDQSLAAAGSALQEDRWLTVLSRSSLDRAARRVLAERKVLGDARTIMADYVQMENFAVSLFDVDIDFDGITAASKARDLHGIEVAIGQVRSDIAKAKSLDKAPGLPPQVDRLMRLIQVIGDDFARVFSAALAHNTAAVAAAEKVGSADIAKLRAFDFSTIVTDIEAFYTPMVDAYNADVARAAAI
jgi:hypothetical protein